MTEFTSKKLKQEFYSYFKSKDHKVVRSSSVVPANDPSLLFTNSGMVQFKSILMGEETEYKRACSIQRCIRAGGKHNDLDDVGKDTYHHTYFEMLGNWSFGDYFKKEAIDYAWDFLVNTLKIDRERLYVTYYKEMDRESFTIWKKYLPEERIIAAGKKDNFWEMGDTGPCGPCTEIHYDRIGGRDASHLVNKDDPDVLEIWNIVFIEYNRTQQGLHPLERRCIDTGIGFERLLSILNNVRSNYLTSCFLPIINKLEMLSNKKYRDEFSIEDTAFRAIADHCRTIAVCLIDNVEFSNEGQGYVLRRILRRAVRYAHDILKLQKGDLGNLIKDVIVEFMLEDFEYAELETIKLDISLNENRIEKIIKEVNCEEEKFLETLQKGLERFRKMCTNASVISSEDIFRLYDTYGFPTDLVKMLAEENGVKLDFSKFDECKNTARNLSKKTSTDITEIILPNIPVTDDQFKYNENGIGAELQFYTLEKEIYELKKKKETKNGSQEIYSASSSNEDENCLVPEDTKIGLVFDRTCFYAECGGQVGDTGTITFYTENKEVGKFQVLDCKKISGYVLHFGTLKGTVSTEAILEYDDRSSIERNHTATHLFNYYLRQEIETSQRGSLVAANKLRFDFEGQKLNLKKVEDNVNLCIEKKLPVTVKYMSKEDLKNEKGVIFMENEKYPSIVRIICIGDINTDMKELCGGCHVKNTGDIYKFRIISESGVSRNVRRILGITGEEVKKVEEEIAKLKEKIRNGEVVKIDTNIPLFERINLEEKMKENKEILICKKNENYKKNFHNLKMIIAVTRDHFSGTHEKIVMEYQCFEHETKKDINKNLLNLTKLFDDNETFLVYARINSTVYGVVRQENTSYVLETITNGYFKENNKMLHFNFEYEKSVVDLFK